MNSTLPGLDQAVSLGVNMELGLAPQCLVAPGTESVALFDEQKSETVLAGEP